MWHGDFLKHGWCFSAKNTHCCSEKKKKQKKSILSAQIHTAAKAFLIWAMIAISDLSASVVLLLPGPATKTIQIELRKQHRTVKKIFYLQACEFQKINPETQYFSKYFL